MPGIETSTKYGHEKPATAAMRTALIMVCYLRLRFLIEW